MNELALQRVIDLLEATVVGVDKSEYSCRQFLMTLLAVQTSGITQRELAQRLDMTESGVSRSYKSLGPEGSGCLNKVDGKVVADPHVIDALAAIFRDW